MIHKVIMCPKCDGAMMWNGGFTEPMMYVCNKCKFEHNYKELQELIEADERVITSDNDVKSYKRIPITITPREIWEYDRMQELAKAICSCIDLGEAHLAKDWTEELLELLNRVGEH